MMQSSLCLALLATVSALQAPTSLTQQRRVVAQRAPLDLSAPKSSTALCAADDDGYEAPKIEFDPDAPTGGRDLWSDWKNGIYIGSVAIGVLLPVFFFVVRP
mmetsp:Transcript_19193/g.49934  ORF Transcript_19193/g.49934 Transcript_19193/m.49934 type:complete len:102 (-) Transcript_19193:91-396(-)